jgi:hypothetical protein
MHCADHAVGVECSHLCCNGDAPAARQCLAIETSVSFGPGTRTMDGMMTKAPTRRDAVFTGGRIHQPTHQKHEVDWRTP